MQFDLFESNAEQGDARLPLVDAQVHYFPAFLEQKEADLFFKRLRHSLKWRQDRVKLYGKVHQIPRLQAWYGEPQATYRYSNLALQPLPWTTELADLKSRCEQQCQHAFNAVLANLYRDGQDSMGWHSDDEPELGEQPVIASISLGQRRNFDLQHKQTREKYRIPLAHGSLLVMAGSTQAFWQHGIAKTRMSIGERINLTFRYIF